MVKRIDINDRIVELDEIEDKLRRTTVALYLDVHNGDLVSAKNTLHGLSERLNDIQINKLVSGIATPDLDAFMLISLWIDNRTYKDKVRKLSDRVLELKGQLASRGISPRPERIGSRGADLSRKYKGVAELFGSKVGEV